MYSRGPTIGAQKNMQWGIKRKAKEKEGYSTWFRGDTKAIVADLIF